MLLFFFCYLHLNLLIEPQYIFKLPFYLLFGKDFCFWRLFFYGWILNSTFSLTEKTNTFINHQQDGRKRCKQAPPARGQTNNLHLLLGCSINNALIKVLISMNMRNVLHNNLYNKTGKNSFEIPTTLNAKIQFLSHKSASPSENANLIICISL